MSNDTKEPCYRCGGAGGSSAPNWLPYGVFPGACFRCRGTGIDPNQEWMKSREERTMCGSVAHEGIKSFISKQDVVEVERLGKRGKATVSGHCRIDKLSWWRKEGDAVAVDICADSFTEGSVEFRVPGGRISGLGLRRDVTVRGNLIGKAKTARIITREARTPLERATHNRFPVVIVDGELYEFTEKDVVDSEVPIQKELF